MYFEDLEATMEELLQPGKGILAADESIGTIGKRFADISLENNETNRLNYRLLLTKTEKLENYVNGMILFEETFTQKDEQGKSIPQLLAQKGILPGIKVDKGLINLPNTDEKVTWGLDGLEERLLHFKQLGARFAKWRNVYAISESSPSLAIMRTGAENLARYALACQAAGIVPIVEPEVLMDGDHDIEACAQITEMVLHELFHALYIHQVDLESMILKPSMVTSGKAATPFSPPEEVGDYTITVFRNNVPAAVPAICFLSGGQGSKQASINLNAINSVGQQPWLLSFSYGRALQEECLKQWAGKAENVKSAQETLLHRARMNSLASLGEYNASEDKS
jgi:fructose-bisphosphate aldolase class I